MIHTLLPHMPSAVLETVIDRHGLHLLTAALPNLPSRDWLLARWRKLDAATAAKVIEHLDTATAAAALAGERRITVFRGLCRNRCIDLSDELLDCLQRRDPSLVTDVLLGRMVWQPRALGPLLARRQVQEVLADDTMFLPLLAVETAKRYDELIDFAAHLPGSYRGPAIIAAAARGDIDRAKELLAGCDITTTWISAGGATTSVFEGPVPWSAVLAADRDLFTLMTKAASLSQAQLDVGDFDDATLDALETADLQLLTPLFTHIDQRLAWQLLAHQTHELISLNAGIDDAAVEVLIEHGLVCPELLGPGNSPEIVARVVDIAAPQRDRRGVTFSHEALAAVFGTAVTPAALTWALRHASRQGIFDSIYETLDTAARVRLAVIFPSLTERLRSREEIDAALDARLDLSGTAHKLLTGPEARNWPTDLRRRLLTATVGRWPAVHMLGRTVDEMLEADLAAVIGDLDPHDALRALRLVRAGVVDDKVLDTILDQVPLARVQGFVLTDRMGRRLREEFGADPATWESISALWAEWTGTVETLVKAVRALETEH